MHRMMIAAALLGTCLMALPAFAQGDVYVQGHFRSDGTYVQPYYRSAPNNSRLDNWSVKPNINPYTGQKGTRNPYPALTPMLPQSRNSPLYPAPPRNAPTYRY